MKTIKWLLLVIGVFFIILNVGAQTVNFDLQIKHVRLSTGSDTANIGQTITVSFYLANMGVDSFINNSGAMTIPFYMHFDTNKLQPTPFSYSLSYQYADSNQMVMSLRPFDSVLINIQVPISSSYCTVLKDNEIVIWPKLQTHESNPNNNYARYYFYCDNSAGFNSIANNTVSIYPIPTSNFIYIQTDENVKAISVFDIFGECIYNAEYLYLSKNYHIQLDFRTILNEYGVYFIIINTNKKHYAKKVLFMNEIRNE